MSVQNISSNQEVATALNETMSHQFTTSYSPDELPAFAKRIAQVRQANNVIATHESHRQSMSTDSIDIRKSVGDILAEKAAAITQMRNERKPHVINPQRQREMEAFLADQEPEEESAFDAGNRIQQSMHNYQDRYYGNNKPKVEMPDDYFTKLLSSHNQMTRTRTQDDINELNAINADLHRKQMEILTGVKQPRVTTDCAMGTTSHNTVTTINPVTTDTVTTDTVTTNNTPKSPTYRINVEPNGGTINHNVCGTVCNSIRNETEYIEMQQKSTEFFEPLSPISSAVSDAEDLDSLADLSITKHTIANPVVITSHTASQSVNQSVQTNITINPDIKIQKETIDDIKRRCTVM